MNVCRTIGLLAAALLVVLQHGSGASPGDSVTVVAPGAALKQVSSQFTFTEGPAVDKKGRVFFTDQPNDKIWLYDTDGTLSVFMDKTGRANGLYVAKNGNLIACADQKNELWSIDPQRHVTVLLTNYQGHRFNGPNDVWLDAKGGIYFTDPYYQRDYWDRQQPDLTSQNVYYLPRGSHEAVLAAAELMQPNGLVGTPDGRYLYVADIRANKTYKYRIGRNGQLTDRQLFVNQGSDGMTIDQRGNVYLSGRGVTVYDPAGKKIDTIPVPSKWVGNLCFGGKDRKTLFITASESVYTLAMQVKGVE